MSDDSIVTLYKAASAAEAQLLADALGEEGVEANVEQTPSPFDGVGGVGDVDVFVRGADVEKAKAVLDQFLAEKADDDDE